MSRTEHAAIEGFLLTRQWRDTPQGIELVLWAASDQGPVRIEIGGQEAVCFVDREVVLPPPIIASAHVRREPVELRSLEGRPVDALYFKSQRTMVEVAAQLKARGFRLFESDIKPAERYLMERFITGGIRATGVAKRHGTYVEFLSPKLKPATFRPDLRVVSLDIETADFDGDLYSVAITEAESVRVFLVERPSWTPSQREHLFRGTEGSNVSLHGDETSLLAAFIPWLNEYDPDVIIGWNVVDFDLDFLERRCHRFNMPFDIGRAGETARILPATSPSQKRVARVPGRLVLDGIDTLRNATWSFEDYGLESVAREIVGKGKLIAAETGRVDEVRRLYREAPDELVKYNIRDCRLTEEVFREAKLVDFALERARLTGLNADRVGGSVAAFDHLYLPRLHRKGYVAPDVGDEPEANEESPGGYVIDSRPGLYENVIVLDFKSLYPSIIRSFYIDPLGMTLADEQGIEGFLGARFSRRVHILPGLIEELWSARDSAKSAGNAPLARAIKIIMNSFYGVLGTSGCRFHDPRLVSSITLRGHEIMNRSREWIEQSGYPVLYGDTDSLFVLVGEEHDERECRKLGEELAASLNAFWANTLREEYGVESYLEMELEEHYLRFFMPTIRGSERGSKKRYAGLVRSVTGTVVRFTGLESVRSDWTPLAREFQREIYRLVLNDAPFEDYVRTVAAELDSGRRDHQLVYRKRLRRPLEDYKKNVPPHVQAARKSPRPGRWVRYVITTMGPEPVDRLTAPPDYRHYLERQLAPAADALLQLKGTSVMKILDRQMSLF